MNKKLVLIQQWFIVTHLTQLLFLDNWWICIAILLSCTAIVIAEFQIKAIEDFWERDKEDIIDRLIYEEQREEEC